MIELKLSPQKFEEILKKGYSLDMIFVLKLLEGKCDYVLEGAKIAAIEQAIKRKALITEEGKLTLEGESLIGFLSSEDVKIVRKKPSEEPFKLWWKAYPASDTFDYKGKKFKGTRALRVKKADCEAKLNKILATGEYTIEELVDALKLEIYQKAENSRKTGQNKMSFFQNSLTYLNQGTYDAYVELVRKGEKPEEETTNIPVTANETFI